MCVCVCVHACVPACVRVCACVHACVYVLIMQPLFLDPRLCNVYLASGDIVSKQSVQFGGGGGGGIEDKVK